MVVVRSMVEAAVVLSLRALSVLSVVARIPIPFWGRVGITFHAGDIAARWVGGCRTERGIGMMAPFFPNLTRQFGAGHQHSK